MSVYQKIRKDGSKAWFYDFTISGVRYRAVGGSTKTQALRAQEKVRNEVLDGTYNIKIKSKNPLFEKFAQIYLDRRKHLRSRRRDQLSVRTLLPFFSGKTLNTINPAMIEDYIAYRRDRQISNATINRELACLKHMFNLAIKWDETKINPVKEIKMLEEPPGRTRYLSKVEASRLLEAANDSLRPIIFTALNTGMRLQEILTLKWDQVYMNDVVNPYIEIKQTKNNLSSSNKCNS